MKSILDESLSAIASWLNDQGYMELLLEECGCDCGDPEELEDHGCSAGLAECELVALRMHIGRIFTAYNTTERHNAELMAYIGRIGSCPPLNIQSHYAVIAQSLALLSREGKTLAATGALRSLDALKAEHSRQRKQIADAVAEERERLVVLHRGQRERIQDDAYKQGRLDERERCAGVAEGRTNDK